MQITERHENGIIVFALEGRIDTQGAIDLADALEAAVDSGHYRLVCDMTNVAYINSAALRTLAWPRCRPRSGACFRSWGSTGTRPSSTRPKRHCRISRPHSLKIPQGAAVVRAGYSTADGNS